MKIYLTLKQKRFFIAITTIVFLMTSIFLYIYIEKQKEYINGNILNLPFFNLEVVEGISFQSPWKNQKINAMFMYRSLFIPDHTLQNVKPDLAKNYDISDDGKIYTIVLDENNYWSDGVLITPDDISFTIKAVLKDTAEYHTISEYMYSTVLQYIEGATDYKKGDTDEISGISIDGNIITLKLTTRYNTFLPILSQIVILPNHILKDEDLENLQNNEYWKNPIVSGMYKVSGLVVDEQSDECYFSLVHNEFYTGKRSDIEEVRLHFNYNMKNLDYYITSNMADIINYSSSSDYQRYNIEMLLYTFFVFNISGQDGNYNQPMDNINFRKAIMTAINREQILSHVYLGTGEIINSGVTNNNIYNNNFEHEYNLEKAKLLLAESGYDLERPFTIAYQESDQQTMHLLSNISNNLEKIGINVELLYTFTEEEMYVDREYDMLLQNFMAFNELAWYSEYDNENIFHTNLFSIDDKFDGLFTEVRESPTDEIRKLNLEKLQNLEQENLYILPMFSLNQVAYTYTTRLNVPDNIKFSNSSYRHDIQLEEWSIKKQ